jgi:hypothetical protein
MNSSELLYRRVCTLMTCEGRDEAAHARDLVTQEAAMSVIKFLQKMQFLTVLFVCFAGFSNSLSAAPRTIVSKKDLNVALKTAKTPEDHQRIATYYQEQAKKLQVKENEERDLANYYLTHPSMYGKQYPTPYQNHKGLRDYYHQAAAQALEKADQQAKMAEPAHATELQRS